MPIKQPHGTWKLDANGVNLRPQKNAYPRIERSKILSVRPIAQKTDLVDHFGRVDPSMVGRIEQNTKRIGSI